MLTLWTNWYFKWYCWRIKSSFSLCHIWALQYRISTWSYDALRIVSDSGDWLICIRFLRFRTFRWRVYNFRMEWIQRYWSCNKLPEKNRKSFKHCSLGKKHGGCNCYNVFQSRPRYNSPSYWFAILKFTKISQRYS